jgi:hypothetical protein
MLTGYGDFPTETRRQWYEFSLTHFEDAEGSGAPICQETFYLYIAPQVVAWVDQGRLLYVPLHCRYEYTQRHGGPLPPCRSS